MDGYLNFINSDILTLILSKVNYWEFNALELVVDLNGINYLYLTAIKFSSDMKELAKSLHFISIKEYKLALCGLKVKIGLNSIKTLEEICSADSIAVRGNQIEEIPKEIGNLINLRKLQLPFSQIKEIPKEIGNLRNLRLLDLSFNQIKEIPKEIGNLTDLRRLLLKNNQIKEIPKEIGNLTNLEVLNLKNNQIKEIPKEIGNLPNLRVLYLADNQIKEIPEEVSKLKNIHIYLTK